MISNQHSVAENIRKKLTGSCLCGSVQFEIDAPIRPVVSCYCSECRKTSGNYVSATRVPDSQFNLLKSEGLHWYENDLAQRGFCAECGSNLFWRGKPENGHVSVMAGCLEPKNGLKVEAHIYVADKSDFHEIPDSAPQYLQDDE